jgi:hypothetical protein
MNTIDNIFTTVFLVSILLFVAVSLYAMGILAGLR